MKVQRYIDYRLATMEREQETNVDSAPTTCSNIDDTIIINVGGIRHEVLRDTLQKIPDTLLTCTENIQNHYRRSSKEYFFDRHPQVFSAILNYYRTGELHLPNDVCNVLIKNELEYWEIPETSIEDCCWMRYNAHWDQMNTLAQFETKHNANRKKTNERAMSACWDASQPRLWAFLDDPYSSIPAKVFAWISLLFVLVSIFTFCAETHPFFMVNTTIEEYAEEQGITFEELLENLGYEPTVFTTTSLPTIIAGDLIDGNVNTENDDVMHNGTNAEGLSAGGTSPTEDIVRFSTTGPAIADNATGQRDRDDGIRNGNSIAYDYILTGTNPYMIAVDYFCYCFFTLELFLRILFCDDKRFFFRSFLNIVDIMALIPFYIELIVNGVYGKDIYKKSILDVLLFTRIIRIFRVFRLIRHHRGLQILVFTIRASMKEILLLLLFLGIGMVIFASLIFYADQASGTFKSIPHSFWWAVITMTTVGYGDVVPTTPWGFAIGSCCAVSGVLVIAFTVPVIVNNFLLIYQYVQFKRDQSGQATLGMSDPEKWSRKSRTTTSKVHMARHEFTNGTRVGWSGTEGSSNGEPV